MIRNLQVLRGIAALGVVFLHTDYALAGNWNTQFFGVSTFFVISGFIMCFITRENADGFALKRIERIVPLYWLCTLALAVYQYRWTILSPLTWIVKPYWAPAPLIADLPLSLFFVPSDHTPMLGVGWTLNFEMYFYAVFAVALLISRRFAPLMAAAFICAVILLDRAGVGGFLIHYYAHPEIPFFLYGIAIYYGWSFVSPIVTRPIAMIGALAIIFCYGSQFTEPWLPMFLQPFLLVWAPIIIVAGALLTETGGMSITWRPLILIGDASYAIYLTHTIFFEMMRANGVPPSKNGVALTVSFLAASVAIGIVTHLLIEKPILISLRKIRRRMRDNQTAAALKHGIRNAG